jgi:hypothetical protein
MGDEEAGFRGRGGCRYGQGRKQDNGKQQWDWSHERKIFMSVNYKIPLIGFVKSYETGKKGDRKVSVQKKIYRFLQKL